MEFFKKLKRTKEKNPEIFKILKEFGDTIDYQGSADGDYTTAIRKIKKLIYLNS